MTRKELVDFASHEVGIVVKITLADAYMLKTPLSSEMGLGVHVQTSIDA